MLRRLFAALLLAFAAPLWAAHAWQDSNFAKRIEVTIPSPDANLTAHPAPIKLDGRSIVDTDIADGCWTVFDSTDTRLHWEREVYAEAAGTCTGIIWVAVDQYSAPAGEQNHVWFYYSPTETVANTATNVWDASFKGVWHLSEASGTLADSTGVNTLTQAGTITYGATGAVDGAVTLDGNDDYMTAPSNASLDITGAITVSIWFKSAGFVGDDAGFISKNDDTEKYFASFAKKAYSLEVLNDNIYFHIGEGNGDYGQLGGSSSGWDNNAWCHVAATWDGTKNANGMKIYKNGALTYQGTASTVDSIQAIVSVLDIGGYTTSYNVAATVDDPRVSATNRATAWIKQDYTVVVTGLSYGSIESYSPGGAGTPIHYYRRRWSQ